MKPKTLVTAILCICLIVMATSLVAYRASRPSASSAELMASDTCPVCAPSARQKCFGCGMSLTDSEAPYDIAYQGKPYRFCCKKCAATFEKDPSAFLAKHPELTIKP